MTLYGDTLASLQSTLPPNFAQRAKALKEPFEAALKGLLAIHEANLIHGDIKDRNIFRNGASAVIADLDFCQPKDQIKHNLRGTILFLAPEHVDEKLPFGEAIDYWALGVTFYRLLAGRLPLWSIYLGTLCDYKYLLKSIATKEIIASSAPLAVDKATAMIKECTAIIEQLEEFKPTFLPHTIKDPKKSDDIGKAFHKVRLKLQRQDQAIVLLEGSNPKLYQELMEPLIHLSKTVEACLNRT